MRQFVWFVLNVLVCRKKRVHVWAYSRLSYALVSLPLAVSDWLSDKIQRNLFGLHSHASICICVGSEGGKSGFVSIDNLPLYLMQRKICYLAFGLRFSKQYFKGRSFASKSLLLSINCITTNWQKTIEDLCEKCQLSQICK